MIKSRAEKESAAEFARAAAKRPQIVGAALSEISTDPELLAAVFEVLETRRLLQGNGELVLLPPGDGGKVLAKLLAAT